MSKPKKQKTIPGVEAASPEAKQIVQKIMELVMEGYNLATDLALIDDPKIIKLPVIQSAKRVVAKIRELRDLQQKLLAKRKPETMYA